MTAKTILLCLCLFAIATTISAYAGEYIPKSYYIIANGERSDTVYLRSKRSLLHLMRQRRSAPQMPGIPFADGRIPSTPEEFFQRAQEFFNYLPHGFSIPAYSNLIPAPPSFPMGGSGAGGGGGSYAYASASSSSGGAAPNPGPVHHYANTAPGSPKVFSRMGEAAGNNIYVSGSASGPNGGFSSVSATSDGSGKVAYSVHNEQY